ncbi:MAG: hypothetical protein CVU56_22215 [Deltaproteobacteria bacterium HGW-Deltaproteobacteria-14]|jgi:hypothetical protein|nr:MAG: hypothetical protein CVU56_22215 [Deltaproteobacteria bacterium HGW-Deltaproteobacteria-14]
MSTRDTERTPSSDVDARSTQRRSPDDARTGPPLTDVGAGGVAHVQALMTAGGNLGMVQLRGDGGDGDVHAAAAQGIQGGGGRLPHHDAIQRAFGSHDVGGVQAHTGPAAKQGAAAMGAEAYATGDHVAFGSAPDLHTAAHEAAHVVQQRAGVSLSGGVGQRGDAYEKHADAVADKVVSGQSAQGELDKMAGGAKGGGTVQQRAVQRSPAPPAPPAPPTPPPAPTPLTLDQARAAITGKAASYADLADPLAGTLTSITQADFDSRYASVTQLQADVITEFVKGGDARAQTQQVGKDDPIAIQKFQDIDQEAHLEDPSIKDAFYGKLRDAMKSGSFSDRTRTFPVMKSAAGYSYNFKGKRIPAARLSAVSTRNQGLGGMYGVINTGTSAQIDARITDELTRQGKPQPVIDAAKADNKVRLAAYGAILKGGVDPLSTVDKRHNITQGYGTWYHPGALVPSLPSDPDIAFSQMMTLGALQPEWYAEGTVVLQIDMSGVANRVCRKPTAFDGLMSALWVARNMSDDDYGLTGGGAGEFLEANVPYRLVTSARAVIPSDRLTAELQTLSAAAGGGSTPTEEMLRGTMTPGGASGATYNRVIGSTVREQNTPGASPTLPGAARSTSSAAPAGPAVAPGGAYDRP